MKNEELNDEQVEDVLESFMKIDYGEDNEHSLEVSNVDLVDDTDEASTLGGDIPVVDDETLGDDGNSSLVPNRKMKKKNKWRKWVILSAVLDVLAVIGLFLTYGPVDYFRNLLVTTAMTTKSHHYLARIFYNDDTIAKILANNYVGDIGENTNASDIVIGNEDDGHYDSVYEEQILKRDEGNDLYKIIPISGSSYQGYLVAIYDPSRVSLVLSDYFGYTGQFLNTIANNHEAHVAMNASGFIDINEVGDGGDPTGSVIKDGQLMTPGTSGTVGKLIGFNQDHVLMLVNDTPENAIAQGMVDAVDFGPFLIVNGKSADIRGNGGWGIAPRSVIAQRKDGIVLFLVIDGRQPGYSLGADMAEVIRILTRYKAHNAANLDGGATTSLNIEGKIYSRPCAISATGERPLPNAWIVK